MEELTLPTPDQMRKKARALIPVVNTYLMAKAFAQFQREAVDKIERGVLQRVEFFADRDTGQAQGQRVTEPKYSYLMHDQDLLRYYAEVRRELERAGFRIKQGHNKDGTLSEESWDYRCPALTAESLQRQAERALVDVAAAELGFGGDFFDNLLCAGMDKLKLFVDLTCRLVVGLPDYKRPSLKV